MEYYGVFKTSANLDFIIVLITLHLIRPTPIGTLCFPGPVLLKHRIDLWHSPSLATHVWIFVFNYILIEFRLPCPIESKPFEKARKIVHNPVWRRGKKRENPHLVWLLLQAMMQRVQPAHLAKTRSEHLNDHKLCGKGTRTAPTLISPTTL